MKLRFSLLQICFFISGFAALLYETAWTRELAFVFGTSELAVTAVLAAYMAGLALGAAVAGRWAHRIRRPVLAYGVIELGIGLGALAVPFAIRGLMGIYVNWLGGLDAPPESVGLVTALFHLVGAFLVLVPCTALMGATLPLLARHAVQNDEQVGPRIGYLYAINTAGAICGALTAAFVLLPEFGLRQTIYIGAVANALVFVAAALLSRFAPAVQSTEPRRSKGFSPVLLFIAVSGAVSFVYEVLWVRMLGFVLGASTAAFATMLASFLIGISLGSAIASRFARDSFRAGLGFAFAQLGTALMAWLTFSLADWIPYIAQSVNASSSNLLPGAVMSVLILLPVTVFVGASFPFAVRLMAVDADDAASASARVYAWNTLGSIVGSISAGFWLLPVFGFEGTLLVGAGANLLLALGAASVFTTGRPMRALLATAALAGVALLALRPAPPFALLKMGVLSGGATSGEMSFLGVGRSATVTLIDIPHGHQISTNGLPESVIESAVNSPDLYQEGRWLALLPLLARPEAERVLIVGLGGGRTLAAVPPSVREIELIELEPEVVRANRTAVKSLGLGDPLDDPRLSLRIGDARGALMLTGKNYDAIISQPSHPWTSGASHLYTQEFFELVEERLVPDGVFVQWMGLGFVDDRLLRGLVGTLGEVFDHVTVLHPGGAAILFIASNTEIDLAKTAPRAIAEAPQNFARIGVHSVTDVIAQIRLSEQASRDYSLGSPIISDDHNHLAWARRGKGSGPRPGKALQVADGLPELNANADPLLLVRRLVAGRAGMRASLVISQLPEETRPEAEAWRDLSVRRFVRAAKLFEGILEKDPSSSTARLGLALLKPAGLDLGGLKAPERALIEGRVMLNSGHWEEVSVLDGALAQVQVGHLVYPEAARLRAQWRIASGSPERAWEAVGLIDPLIARDRSPRDLLIRAKAAKLAGRADYAWASLYRLSNVLFGNTNRREMAIAGLDIAQGIPSLPGSSQTFRLLRAQAR
ncbi:MAG: fused MFS/spermidine synthase [Myxococcota bacterium]|nr:fused MFS/spermidine synthase [Myxococcota bacterium]